jgi:branched-chain amino acid transport system permease protein
MLYSEAGQLATDHLHGARSFRLRQERLEVLGVLLLAFVAVPVLGDDYWLTAILIPFLILALSGLGLNLLTGFAGQLSVGSAAFMAIGAYTTYNLSLRLPGIPILLSFALGGVVAAGVGVLSGLPSLRIKGFYLVVSTLAVQFFVEWVFTSFRWFSNDNASGLVSVPPLAVFGLDASTPRGRYLFTLGVVAALTALALNIPKSELGRRWMAVRDMDVAAAVIGIPVLRTKLLAFAVSSFYCGIAGALWGFTYLGTFDPRTWELSRSFQILFIIIIGGMGSIIGSFLGSAFMLLLPIAMSQLGSAVLGGNIDQGAIENYKKIAFGVLIVAFLIREPGGLARLLRRARERASIWPLRSW